MTGQKRGERGSRVGEGFFETGMISPREIYWKFITIESGSNN